VELQVKAAVSSPAARVAALRILVVDDNEDSARSLAMIPELEGHRVESVYSSQHALERVGSFAPDVVLLTKPVDFEMLRLALAAMSCASDAAGCDG
jgi:PleD family two-component response regulator